MSLVYSKTLEIGSSPLDFSLKSTDRSEYSLSNLSSKKGLLILFTCNHCPYAKASWPILIELSNKYPGIQFCAINPNDSTSHPDDSFESMIEEVKVRNIKFPYLHDTTQEVAKQYKAQCTPDPYLYKQTDTGMELYYHGRINDNWQDSNRVSENSLEEAIIKLLANEESPSDQSPSMGCSIKWKAG
jgi:thiol-disulfide isomerase/thioredoxin